MLDGAPVHFDTDRTRALLTYLVLGAEQPHRRETLVGLLWPEWPDVAAMTNLRNSLSSLRKAIGDRTAAVPLITADRNVIQFTPAADTAVDVLDFRHLTGAQQPLGDLEQAVALYRGPLLDGFSLADSEPFEAWLQREREGLAQGRLTALERLAEGYEAQGELARAREAARRQVDLAPWHEEGQRRLMRLLALQGQRSAALNQYETCRQALQRELGVEPAAETRALYEQVRAGRLAVSPGVRQRPATLAHNLPPQLLPFFGRERELAELAERLADPACRLLTVVGLGGVGKTRLAIQATLAIQAALAQAVPAAAGRFAHGVTWVPLAPAAGDEYVLPAIAGALGVSAQGGMNLKTVLLGYLEDRELLLVLDNCEHVLGGMELIPEILAAAPGVKVLATSRERLKLQSEWVHEIGGLPYPQADDATTAEDFDAVRLFISRAQQQRRDFPVAAELPQVVALCRLVDGMPLALELAAANSQALTTGEIVQALAQGLDVLAAAQRDVPPRQRTLRAVLDQTWQGLSDSERAAWAQLSVFRGGWEREAGQEVAGAGPLLLARLQDRALIRRDAGGRYDMHPLAQQYVAEKLAAAGEEAGTRRHHAAYYAGLAGKSRTELIGSAQLVWAGRLRAESDNLRAALVHCVAARDLDTAESLCGPLWFLATFAQWTYAEVRGWLEAFVAAAKSLGRRPPPWLRFLLTGLVTNMGDYAGALEELQLAEAEARAGEQWEVVVDCLLRRGLVLHNVHHDLKAGRACLDEGVALSRRIGYHLAASMGYRYLALLAWDFGDKNEAVRLMEESGAEGRLIGDRYSLGQYFEHMGDFVLEQGDPRRALALYTHSFSNRRELGGSVMGCLRGMAKACVALGRPAVAVRLMAFVEVERRRSGIRWWPAMRAEYEALVESLAGALGPEGFKMAWTEGQALTADQALELVLASGVGQGDVAR
jgi:predicted ATPase/DNA-binding SARP family transcriptional activator